MPSFKSTFFTLGLVTNLHVFCSAAKTCNVLNYGAVADSKTDIGPALMKAFEACKSFSTGRAQDTVVLVPPGKFSLATNVIFAKGNGITFTFNGELSLIYSTTLTGNMILFKRNNDIIINGTGRFLGNGDAYRPNGNLHRNPPRPRLVRIENCVNVDYSGFSLYDSPMFHLTTYLVTNAKIHDFEIHSKDIGTTDAISAAGQNIHIYNLVLEGGDECVSAKSPTDGMLVENIRCIHTDGCSLGSMGPSAKDYSIKNVMFRNISLSDSSNGIVVKSYPSASGVINNLTCIDFKLTNVAYPIKLDYSWGATKKSSRMREKRGEGGQRWSDMKFIKFRGTGTKARSMVTLNCPPETSCRNMDFKDINISGGKSQPVVSSACGSVDASSQSSIPSLPTC